MSRRNPFQRALRILLVVLMVTSPLIWALPLQLSAVAMGALLAYEGPTRRVLFWSVVLLTVVELLGGMNLGILTLPLLASALLLAVAGRVFSLTPWVGADGWRIGDLVRTILCATFLAACMTAGSVLVGSLMYARGLPLARLALALTPDILVAMAILTIITVVILRRIDVPLRRPIRFGI